MSADDTMKKTAKSPQHDWSRFDAMTEAERHAAALADPDAQPFTEKICGGLSRTPQARSFVVLLGFRRKNLPRGSIFRSERCVTGSRAVKSPTPRPAPICG